MATPVDPILAAPYRRIRIAQSARNPVKSTPKAHHTHPWRVHTLARDFELIDVWRFELRLDEGHGFDEFLATYWEAIHTVENSLLSKLRLVIGRIVGWDDAAKSLPIPGCTERTVADRLDAADHARNLFSANEPCPLPVAHLKPVYRFEDEVLYEVSNATVHALMHVSCAPGESPLLGVYIKSRGVFTRLYMAAIWPARHAVVYPSLMSRVESGWRTRLQGPARPVQ